MKSNKILLERVEYLLDLANKSLATKWTTEDSFFYHHWVSNESFKVFETSSLSFILATYGEKHPYYTRFKESVTQAKPDDVKAGKGILTSIKTEIEKGWLSTIKGLISAEIFSDFLEMAEHLLTEKYEHPAAVMIGSVLEEHLRQLCDKSDDIDIIEIKNGKTLPKKADLLNADLAKHGIYNKLDQKNITAWLDLRNKAAHGKYAEYNIKQVEFMLQGVREFMTRNSI
ncbi:MAG: hypothetical protein QM727_06995 [Niabella sp.]